MVDEIITPGMSGAIDGDSTELEESPVYLIKDNHLSEFNTETDRAQARRGLNIYSIDEVNEKIKDTVNGEIKGMVTDSMSEHLMKDDPHNIMDKVRQQPFVKTDGSTPFTQPQKYDGDPKYIVLDSHLTTKKFVTDLLNSHRNDKKDPHGTMSLVNVELEEYAKKDQIYLKRELYDRKTIDKLFASYIPLNYGKFTIPWEGKSPVKDSHLTTKKYVDQAISNHVIEYDPHGYITLLNERLAKIYTKNDTYSKAEVYSRAQVDSMVYRLVSDAAKLVLEEHINQSDPHGILDNIYYQHYVPRDGSVAFTNPQKGVEGIEDNDLVVLSQLNEVRDNLNLSIAQAQPLWKTSGPVQTTVGFMENNSPVPTEMSLQEVLDAIFYGKGISLTVPEYTNITETCKVVACVRGSLGMVEYAELFQDGELLFSFTKEDFEQDSCITINSEPIFEDAEFTFKVYYLNGTVHDETKITKCSIPIFIGTLPKWKSASTVSYNYLLALSQEDPVNNKFYSEGQDVKEITHEYNFSDVDLKHLFIVVPEKYPDLYQMRIPSQQFDVEAFDIINMTPQTIPGVPKDIIYKMYVYRQAVSSANQETTFKFKK